MATSNFNSAGQLNQLEHDPENHAKRVNNYIWNSGTGAWERYTGSASSAPVALVSEDLFDSVVTASRYNQVEIDFSSTDPDAITDLTVTKTVGGDASNSGGQAVFTSGANTSGGVKAVTNTSITYRPHAESFAAFTAIFTAGLADSYQRIGIYDTNNGFFIGYEGTSFGVTKRSGAADTTTAQASFSEDTLTGQTGSGYTRNNTPEAVDFTKDNLFRIRFGWLGAAPIYFEIFSPDGHWVVFHKIKHPNTAAVPTIQNPNLPITLDIQKTTAGATVLTMNTACWAAGSTSNFMKLVDTITDNTLAGLNRSVISGRSSTGGGTYYNVKVNPSGSLITAIGDISGIVGQNTMANSIPVTIASNQTKIKVDLTDTAANAVAIKVDGSAVTQPVSGTVTANIGTTNGLALDATLTGGTQKTKLVDTGGTNVASISVGGALKVDGSAVTQPVSGTFWQTTQPVSGTVTANAGTGSFTVAQATAANLNATVTGTVTANAGTGSFTVAQGTATNLKAQAENYQGGTAVGAANPLQVTLANTGANATAVKVDGSAVTQPVSGTVSAQTYSTSTVTSVAGSASSVQLLASTAGRKAAYFYNDSTADCYLKLGTTASTSSFTVKMVSNSFYELPQPCYTGRIDAIWTSATGNIRITEIT
jgi:hypothetical protein